MVRVEILPKYECSGTRENSRTRGVGGTRRRERETERETGGGCVCTCRQFPSLTIMDKVFNDTLGFLGYINFS